mmetsp:Transcript_13021/g.31432  ORF Transcript_13021/g.31432 Transcript_13021/m.31432 type:complete len:228 (-) Transcript_13021:236-919(-)
MCVLSSTLRMAGFWLLNSPLSTVLMSARRSLGMKGLLRNPSMPTAKIIAANSVPMSALSAMMTLRFSLPVASSVRMSRVASTPSITGIMWSIKMASKCPSPAAVTASTAALPCSQIVTAPPAFDMMWCTSFRLVLLSSTRRIFMPDMDTLSDVLGAPTTFNPAPPTLLACSPASLASPESPPKVPRPLAPPLLARMNMMYVKALALPLPSVTFGGGFSDDTAKYDDC